MLKITVCIGSSCHIKGSRQVVEQIQNLIAENNLGDKVELCGTFCLGKCQQGVCVMVNDDFFSVSPDTVDAFCMTSLLTYARTGSTISPTTEYPDHFLFRVVETKDR